MNETVGEQLKKARLDRGLTLMEASHQTRIRAHYLEALENDRHDLLPSAVQGRGFLRLYGDFLKLPAIALVDRWENSLAAAQQSAPQPQSPEHTLHAADTSAITDEELVEVDAAPQEPAAAPPIEPKSSEMILVEIGQRLRRQREALNLKIADIERFTHLRSKYIDALEHGSLDDLPSPVQGRGMLSNYARFLDLDDEAILLRFADALQLRLAERTAPKARSGLFTQAQPRKREGISRLLTPDLALSSLIIISLFAFAIWSAAQVSAIREDIPADPSLIPISNLMLTVSPVADIVVPTATPAATRLPQQLAGIAENPEEEELEVVSTLPVIGDAPIQLYIVAKQRAYLQIISDNRQVFVGRVIPGNAYPFSGQRQVELLTGNAAALQVFFNQQDLGVLGNVGEVARLVFVPAGLITPTPAATATPTPTLPPTFTPTPTVPIPTPTVTPFIPGG
jgi:cytoskeletal protein RodZ